MRHWTRRLRPARAASLAAAACLLAAGTARADKTALAFTGGALDTTFTGTLGWEFTVKSTITVTQLGLFDDGTSLLAGHGLAVFDLSGQVYALGTVGASSARTGLFSYAPVTSSFPLAPGDYLIGAFVSGGDDYAFDDGLTPITIRTAPEISFVEDRYHDSSTDSAPALASPESTDQDPADPVKVKSYFGPDFRFVDGSAPVNSTGPLPGLPPGGAGVPEPAPVILLGAGLLALLGRLARRRHPAPGG